MSHFALDDNAPQLIGDGEATRVERPTEVFFVDGKPHTNDAHVFHVRASIQPMSGRELNILPEGDRIKEQISIWTDSSLLLNDIVTYKCARYQVQNVEKWPGYTKARAARIDAGINAAP